LAKKEDKIPVIFAHACALFVDIVIASIAIFSAGAVLMQKEASLLSVHPSTLS